MRFFSQLLYYYKIIKDYNIVIKMNKKLNIFLAGPRGFCAGVDRAIEMVKEALNKYGQPVYVRHEIVHNK